MQLVSKIFNLCGPELMIHQRHRQTNRRTDEQTDDMRSQDCALHYSASHGKHWGVKLRALDC